MNFFQTTEGRPHVGRVVGVLYLIALLPECLLQHMAPISWARIMMTAGWWLSFGDKRQRTTWAELVSHPRTLLGTILLLFGLVGGFFVL